MVICILTIKQALKEIRDGQWTGPDGILLEAWKVLEEKGYIAFLRELMVKFTEQVLPEEWRE